MLTSYRLMITGTRWGRIDVARILDAHVATHGRPRLVVCCGDWDEKKGRATFRGVDKAGRDWAQARGLPFVEVLALWHQQDAAAGPIRNTNAVAHCTEGDHCVVFPHESKESRGTRDCAARARRAGLRVFVHGEFV